jgi:membrane protein
VISVTKAQPVARATWMPGLRHADAVRQVFTQTVAKAWHDRILGLSAETAFWQLLSLPSLVLAVLGAIGFISKRFGPNTVDQVEQQLLTVSRRTLAPAAQNIIEQILDDVLRHGRFDVISIGGVISLWAGSSAMATFVNTITIAYGMRDLRGAVRSRLLALWLYLVSLSVLVVILPLLVIGPTQLRRITPESWHGATDDLVRIGYWPVLGGLLLLGLAALYHYATPVRLRWRRALPGAAVALAVLVGGTAGLRVYVVHVVGKAVTYGVLAAPIAALLFFYITAVAVLLGAELNATLERLWPRGPKKRRYERIRDRLATNGAAERKAS